MASERAERAHTGEGAGCSPSPVQMRSPGAIAPHYLVHVQYLTPSHIAEHAAQRRTCVALSGALPSPPLPPPPRLALLPPSSPPPPLELVRDGWSKCLCPFGLLCVLCVLEDTGRRRARAATGCCTTTQQIYEAGLEAGLYARTRGPAWRGWSAARKNARSVGRATGAVGSTRWLLTAAASRSIALATSTAVTREMVRRWCA